MSSYQAVQGWLLDLILTIMSLCLFLVFAPILWSPTPSSSHLPSPAESLPNWFSLWEKRINIISFCPDDGGKVSWLTPIPPLLYTWDTDYNDNIIADILHNTSIQSQLGIQHTDPSPGLFRLLGSVVRVTVSSQWNISTKRVMLLSRMCHWVSTEIFLMDCTPSNTFLSALTHQISRFLKNISSYISCLSVFINIISG